MKHAETVTFGGSGLNRAAELRGQTEEIAALLLKNDTRVFPIWRGRVLLSVLPEGTGQAANWITSGHPLMKFARDTPVFLGFDEDCACFAIDVSSWQPDAFDAEAFGQFFDTTEYRHASLPDGQRFIELRAAMTVLTAREAELLATAKSVLSWHESHGFCARCGSASIIGQSGWQRDCPSCTTPHFPRTDPVVIMLITHGNDVLVGRSPGWPEGMYSLLAGFVEPGETMEAAVRREVKEEAGLEVGAVSYLTSQPWPFPSSLMFGCAGEALSREITIDPTEIEDARWVSREDMARAFAGEHPEILPARTGAIAHFILFNWLSDRLK